MRHLLLVRHGQSEWNREHRIQGQAGTGLTDLGTRQVKRAAAWLGASHPDARVVSSDLQRCRETAAPIAASLGVEVDEDRDLRERDFGDWTGRLVDDVEREHADLFARWRQGEDIVPEVGGESSAELSKRVVGALERTLADLPDPGVAVVVTHGGPVWHGTAGFLGLPDDVLGGVANASITELIADESWGRRLNAWNQVAHLPPEMQTWLRAVREAREGQDESSAAS